MDVDTLILFLLTSAAFGWFLVLRINEARQYTKELTRREQDARARAKRIKELTNRQ